MYGCVFLLTYLCTLHVPSIYGGQKRNLISGTGGGDDCELPRGAETQAQSSQSRQCFKPEAISSALIFFFLDLFIRCIWKLCLHLHICPTYMARAYRGQRRNPDTLELELQCFEPPCGRWELNSGLLHEQRVLFNHWATSLAPIQKVYIEAHEKKFILEVPVFCKNKIDRWSERRCGLNIICDTFNEYLNTQEVFCSICPPR